MNKIETLEVTGGVATSGLVTAYLGTPNYGSNIAKALVQAQSEMANATKDAKNPFFKSKFADLNSIREVTIPPLNKYGITVLQPCVSINGQPHIRTMLLHTSGEQLTSEMPIITAKPNDPQAFGAAISYMRRYSLQSFLCVGAEDSDAEEAMNRSQSSKENDSKYKPSKLSKSVLEDEL